MLAGVPFFPTCSLFKCFTGTICVCSSPLFIFQVFFFFFLRLAACNRRCSLVLCAVVYAEQQTSSFSFFEI